MDLFNPNSKIYLLCKSIKNNIYVYGGDFEIYAVFDFKGQFITYSEVNCFNTLKASIYKTTILSLYLYLIIECYKEFDFFLIKTIEKRNLLNYSVKDLADTFNMSEQSYKNIEEGLIEINESIRKEICVKLNIKAITRMDFFDIYFKLVR